MTTNKKLVSMFVTVCLLVTTIVLPSFAAQAESTSDFVDSALTVAEALEKGIPVDKSVIEKTREELIQEGVLFYGGTVQFSNARASMAGVLGYVTASGQTYVYSERGYGTQLGYLEQREIVQVASLSGDYAYIQFLNADQVLTYGYVHTSAVFTPVYGWSKPLSSGRITNYHNNSSGHNGIDVGGHSGSHPSLYAVNAGTAAFKETVKQTDDGPVFADYGKHVRLTFGSYDIVYGHMHSLSGVTTNNYISEGYPSSYPNVTDKSTTTLATRSVSKGATLGTVGTTGKSSGIHLHFEVRVNGVSKDPFQYIVFPKVGWRSSDAL